MQINDWVEQPERAASFADSAASEISNLKSEISNLKLVPIKRYTKGKREAGVPFDPWLLGHLRAGVQFGEVVSTSIQMEDRIRDWEPWTGLLAASTGKPTCG